MWEFQLYLFVFGLLATRGVSGFYYGLNAGATPAAAESYCQSIGLRLAVLETLAEYVEAKNFLENYQAEYEASGDNVWIGLERDISAPTTHTYKWTDGNPLTYASFGTYPWKDASTPVDDLTKTCIRLDWGSELKFEPYDCTESMDFLCEGFHLVTPDASWNTAKSGCEGINMRLASLSNFNAIEAAEQFIEIKRRISPGNYNNRVWFGIKCVSGTYYYDDGSGAVTYGSDDENSPWDSGEPNSCECGAIRRHGGDYKWTDEDCSSNAYSYLCKDEFVPINITTTTSISTTTTAIPETTTKPWWFVEYSEDGKALGKNGLTFDKSTPPARFGIIGMAIGFGVFSFIIAVVCMLWFCCIRSKDDYSAQEDSDDEEEKEKRKKVAFTAISAKPHGLQYIA